MYYRRSQKCFVDGYRHLLLRTDIEILNRASSHKYNLFSSGGKLTNQNKLTLYNSIHIRNMSGAVADSSNSTKETSEMTTVQLNLKDVLAKVEK